MKYTTLLLCSLALTVSMSACGPTPSDTPIAVSNQTETPSTEMVQEETSPMFFSTPSSLLNCTPTIVTLTWDVRNEYPEVNTVRILVGSDEELKLFSIASSADNRETGRWVRPGTIFHLMDNSDDNNLLRRIVIGGPKCN